MKAARAIPKQRIWMSALLPCGFAPTLTQDCVWQSCGTKSGVPKAVKGQAAATSAFRPLADSCETMLICAAGWASCWSNPTQRPLIWSQLKPAKSACVLQPSASSFVETRLPCNVMAMQPQRSSRFVRPLGMLQLL